MYIVAMDGSGTHRTLGAAIQDAMRSEVEDTEIEIHVRGEITDDPIDISELGERHLHIIGEDSPQCPKV